MLAIYPYFCIFEFFPSGHLHSGNIAIVDGKCKLLDLENFLLGVPSQYRPYYTQYRKIQVK